MILLRPYISLNLPVNGCTAQTASWKLVDNQLAAPNELNSEEIVSYVANTSVPSTLAMKTPISKSVNHILMPELNLGHFVFKSGCLTSQIGLYRQTRKDTKRKDLNLTNQ